MFGEVGGVGGGVRNYYRVMLGKKSSYAEACFAGGFIGVDFDVHQDLTNKLSDEWRDFNREFIPGFLSRHPEKTKIGAGLACGFLWTVSKGIKRGDFVLCPDGSGRYRVGEVVSDYSYKEGEILPHRRAVNWLSQTIDRADMSTALKNSAGSIGTVCNLTSYGAEIENLIGTIQTGAQTVPQTIGGEVIQDLTAFAMEKHLEDFLVENWHQTELGKEYDIYEEDGEQTGQQYPTDTGPLDILAVSKDKKHLLVVELKKGRTSDAVVGQALRYMSYVQEELAEEGQTVRGVIIALEDDPRIRRALKLVPTISFFRYQISFRLMKG